MTQELTSQASLEFDILAAVLHDPRLIGAMLRNLEAEDFVSESGRSVFDAIGAVAKRDGAQAVGFATVRDQLKRDGTKEQAILALMDPMLGEGLVGSFEPKCRRLRDRRRVRTLTQAASEITRTNDPDEAMGLLNDAMLEANRLETRENTSLADIIDELLDERERELRDESRIRTGLPTLDGLLGGGFAPGYFGIIAARTGVGKTVLGLQLAAKALEANQPVLYVTLEETRTRLVERLIRHIARIPRSPRNEFDPLYGAGLDDKIRLLPLTVVNGPVDLDGLIGQIVDRVNSREGVGLVVVDYIGLFQTKHPENRVQEISEITARLKNATLEHSVPIVGLAQINRQPAMRTDRRPTLTDLRDSGSIEQDADVVVLLHREGELTGRNGQLRLAKNRYGSPAEFPIQFDYVTGHIVEEVPALGQHGVGR